MKIESTPMWTTARVGWPMNGDGCIGFGKSSGEVVPLGVARPGLRRRTESGFIIVALVLLPLLTPSRLPAQVPVSITVIPPVPRQTDTVVVACAGGTTSNFVRLEKTLSVSGAVVNLAVSVHIGLLTVIDSWNSRDTLGLLPPGSHTVNLDLRICHSDVHGAAICDSVQRFTKDFGVTVGILTPADPIHGDPVLGQNYPNPFNPSTTIRFGLPWRASVRLTVYSPLGGEIATLASEEREAGIHTVEFNGSRCASGVYFYRLRAQGTGITSGGQFSQTKKLIIIR